MATPGETVGELRRKYMPCTDGPRDSGRYNDEELRRVTRAACDLLQRLRLEGSWPGLIPSGLSPETVRWVKQHDLEDKRRVEDALRASRIQEAREAVVAKLSPEERRLLGI